MPLNAKHIATFILGAAAGFAASWYMNMSDEEREKLSADLKNKANKLKSEAEGALDKTKEYFQELKAKGWDVLKEHLADAEKMMNEMFGNKAQKQEPENPL